MVQSQEMTQEHHPLTTFFDECVQSVEVAARNHANQLLENCIHSSVSVDAEQFIEQETTAFLNSYSSKTYTCSMIFDAYKKYE
jgi:hypothetical protein